MKTNVLILVAAMLLGVANGWAQSGTCGANLTWSLSGTVDNYTLTISGSGAMDDYGDNIYSPWYAYRRSITAVTIGNGVTTIGEWAFGDCYDLTSVTIPNSVTTIGARAFALCFGLTAVTIPSSVTAIGNNAFSSCISLTAATIPSSVTAIGNNAFAYCEVLTSIHVDDDNTHYSSENGILFNKSKTTIVRYPAGKTDVAYIIPNGVTTIGYGAFHYCVSLTAVTIPSSVTAIEDVAFYGCSGLTAVTIPSSVTTIGNVAFNGCDGLTAIAIPNSVTTLGNYAFAWCSGLSAVTISNSLTMIGANTFASCSGLTAITIPSSVTTIGEMAFYGCSGLTAITIPNSVTTIEKQAFFYCYGLTAVTISSGVTAIGDYAFLGCRSLTAINVDDSNKNYSSENGVLFNKSKTILLQYPAAKTDATYTIPDIVTTIGERAFYNCSVLTAVTIPDSVTTIGNAAFFGCSDLTSITIPDSVTTIEDYAFYGCRSLTSITIPNSVTTIGDMAFASCFGIDYLIGEMTGCFYTPLTYLKEVTVAWTNPLAMSGGISYGRNISAATLRIPPGTEALYQTAPVWKDFGTIVAYDLTGNENIRTSTLTAYASNGILYISGLQPGKPIHIYTLAGQPVYKGLAKETQASVAVAARGIYIVAAGAQTVKVIYN